jgi:hypothetical protein
MQSWDVRTAHKSLDRKQGGRKKKPLERPTMDGRNIFKQILRHTKCNDVVSFTQDSDNCEHGTESSGYTQCWGFS